MLSMMKEILRESWTALARSRTRSLLTMLGIVWGIVAVTLLIAYGSGFRTVLVHAFNAFGKSTVIAGRRRPASSPAASAPARRSSSNWPTWKRFAVQANMVKHACLETVKWLPIALRRSPGQHRDPRRVSRIWRNAQRDTRSRGAGSIPAMKSSAAAWSSSAIA